MERSCYIQRLKVPQSLIPIDMIYILMNYTLCLMKSMYVNAVQIASRNCNGVVFEQYFGSPSVEEAAGLLRSLSNGRTYHVPRR